MVPVQKTIIFALSLTLYPSLSFCGQEKTIDLSRITVVGSDRDYSGRYSIASQAIERSAPGSPLGALESLPLDLQGRRLNADIQTDFSLRGSDFEGVAVTLDGKRINDPQTGHHNSDIPLTSRDIEKVSLDPGGIYSSSVTGAIGGALNIRSRKPKGNAVFLEASAGGHNTYSGLFSMTRSTDELGTRFSVERKASSGFRDDTDYKKLTVTSRTLWEKDDKELELGFGYQEKAFGAYDFYTPGLGFPSKEWTRTYILDSSFSLDKDIATIKPSFLWRRHFDKFMLDKTGLRSSSLSMHRTDVYTPAVYFIAEPSFLGRPELGLEYGLEQITSTTIQRHNREHKAIVLNDTLSLGERSSLRASIRDDHYNKIGQLLTYSLNLQHGLFEHDYLRFSLYRQVRLPSFTELFYSDSTTQGEEGLTAAKSLGYEAGYGYKGKGLGFGCGVFLRDEQDVIDWVKHSLSQQRWRAENTSDARVIGTEGYLVLELNSNISLSSNYTYTQRKRDKQDYIYKYGLNYARHLFNTSLNFNTPRNNFSLTSTYKKKTMRRGWLILSANLGFKVNKNSEAFLNVANIFNCEYQEIEGIPQPGRLLEAGFRFSW